MHTCKSFMHDCNNYVNYACMKFIIPVVTVKIDEPISVITLPLSWAHNIILCPDSAEVTLTVSCEVKLLLPVLIKFPDIAPLLHIS